jgi:hypothetical protein
MFFSNSYFYITIGLQAVCAIHCMRKGNQNKWIWIIVFLPLVGCIAYIFTEMFSNNDIRQVQSGMSSIFNPSGHIKKLEDNLHFSDTFNNRVTLADAYLQIGQTQKAIELYESSLAGNFTENEQVLKQLIIAYNKEKRFDDVVLVAEKIYSLPQFSRSPSHICYAIALEQIGNHAKAEKEFLRMKGRFSNYEARYQYGLFLLRANREADTRSVFSEMVQEASHLSPLERRNNRQWLSLAKDELKKLSLPTS